MVELSVVIPVYGCANSLRILHQRVSKVLDSLTSSYEIVLVDDGSPDGAWDVLSEIAITDPHVKAVRLSRNFGQHAAITAGLARSHSRFTVVMDCDLQDPPEEIPRLYSKALAGYQVVLTRRPRRRQPLMRRISGSVYFRVRKALVGGSLENNMPNLSVLSRKVVDAYLRLGEQNRQYLLIVDWLGFPYTVVDIAQDERYVGKSSYTWGTLLRVAIDGLFFQSTRALRWIVYAGLLIAGSGLGLLVYVIATALAGNRVSGWSGFAVLFLLVAGIMTIAGGLAALYIGKIFDQVKGRPLYVIDAEVADGAERPVESQPEPPWNAVWPVSRRIPSRDENE
jgi:polyisoprenyl-phosphate glycosyltransferase